MIILSTIALVLSLHCLAFSTVLPPSGYYLSEGKLIYTDHFRGTVIVETQKASEAEVYDDGKWEKVSASPTGNWYARDSKNVYKLGRVILGAEPRTFFPSQLCGDNTLLDLTTYKQVSKVCRTDKSYVCCEDKRFRGIDPKSFRILQEEEHFVIFKDKDGAYYHPYGARSSLVAFPNADAKTFELVRPGRYPGIQAYGVDKNSVYYMRKRIGRSAGFAPLTDPYRRHFGFWKNDDGVYFLEEKIPLDPLTVQQVQSYILKDKKGYYNCFSRCEGHGISTCYSDSENCHYGCKKIPEFVSDYDLCQKKD